MTPTHTLSHDDLAAEVIRLRACATRLARAEEIIRQTWTAVRARIYGGHADNDMLGLQAVIQSYSVSTAPAPDLDGVVTLSSEERDEITKLLAAYRDGRPVRFFGPVNRALETLSRNGYGQKYALPAIFARQFAWSDRTFGSGYRMTALLKHIRKELQEIERSPNDPVEWIDVALLALDGAWRCVSLSGASVEVCAATVAEALIDKMAKNRERQWKVSSNPDEPIEHVRGGDGL